MLSSRAYSAVSTDNVRHGLAVSEQVRLERHTTPPRPNPAGRLWAALVAMRGKQAEFLLATRGHLLMVADTKPR